MYHIALGIMATRYQLCSTPIKIKYDGSPNISNWIYVVAFRSNHVLKKVTSHYLTVEDGSLKIIWV